MKPNIKGEFERVLRIFDQNGLFITFNEGQIYELFFTLRDEIPIDGERLTLEDVSEKCKIEEETIRVVKAKYGIDVWEIRNEKSDSLSKMAFGIKTLQRLIQLDNIIIFAFNMKDFDYVQAAFKSMVEAVQKIPANTRKDITHVQKYLYETATDRYEFGESCPFYNIARDTLANFEEFFLYMVNNP